MTSAEIIIANLNKAGLSAGLWERGTMRRIYINGVGHNTKKMSQKLWIDLETGEIKAKTECYNQPDSWCAGQSAQLVAEYEVLLKDCMEDEPYKYGWYVEKDLNDIETVYFCKGFPSQIEKETTAALSGFHPLDSEETYDVNKALYNFEPLAKTPFLASFVNA